MALFADDDRTVAKDEAFSAKALVFLSRGVRNFVSTPAAMRAAIRHTTNNLCKKTATDNAQKTRCPELTDKLVKLLDVDDRLPGFTVTLFTSELERWLKTEDLYLYLVRLQRHLLTAVTPDLWDFTLHYTNDRAKAIQIIAVLFQDYRDFNGEEPVKFTIPREIPKGEELVRMNHTLLFFIHDVLWRSSVGRNTRLYPWEVETFYAANRRLPHFYLVAYLTNLMETNSDLGDAVKMPFLFNYAYEATTMYNDKESENSLSYFHKRFNYIGNINDVYAGYLGAFYAAGIIERAKPYEHVDQILRGKRPLEDIPSLFTDVAD